MSEEMIRPEIRALIQRGNVTPEETASLRCNSWEWQALVPAMNDDAFLAAMQHALDNCFTTRRRPFTTYNEAVEGLYAPELIRRFREFKEAVEAEHDDQEACIQEQQDQIATCQAIFRQMAAAGKIARNPDGRINNCALANRDEEKNCQMCGGACPDREAFAFAKQIADIPGPGVYESTLY